MSELEKLVLVHRYLYYVEANPIISDYEYDEIEKAARLQLPFDNVVHQVGSSLPSSYSEEIKQYALSLI